MRSTHRGREIPLRFDRDISQASRLAAGSPTVREHRRKSQCADYNASMKRLMALAVLVVVRGVLASRLAPPRHGKRGVCGKSAGMVALRLQGLAQLPDRQFGVHRDQIKRAGVTSGI